MSEVLVAQEWRSNSELIRAVFDMHVFPRFPKPDVLDVTYGRGTWWKDLPEERLGWRWMFDSRFGDHLTIEGIYNGEAGPNDGFTRGGADFTNLSLHDASADVVMFDPDYIAPGGRTTSTVGDFNDRYGLKDTYETPEELQSTINAGLEECARVVRPQGLILQKTTDYVSSGHLQTGVLWSLNWGLECGLKVHDLWVHVSKPRMQPKTRKCGKCKGDGVVMVSEPIGTTFLDDIAVCEQCGGTGRVAPRQQHARSNTSTLIIWRKPGRRRKR